MISKVTSYATNTTNVPNLGESYTTTPNASRRDYYSIKQQVQTVGDIEQFEIALCTIMSKDSNLPNQGDQTGPSHQNSLTIKELRDRL